MYLPPGMVILNQIVETFFTANNIVETNRKREIYLIVGPEVYSTLINLLAPAKPKDALFTDIFPLLEKHYNPKPVEIAQSFQIKNLRSR